jgi:hypothetical protein
VTADQLKPIRLTHQLARGVLAYHVERASGYGLGGRLSHLGDERFGPDHRGFNRLGREVFGVPGEA